jgi:Flp pilus assembly protein TadB
VAEKLEPAAPGAAALDPAHDKVGAGAVPSDAAAADTAARQAASVAAGRSWSVTAFYALGLGVQVLLWVLVFLAIAAAIATGGHLTEFRYVHF